ncbi:hypothetical protein KP509_1Z314600 [Ceratopteris richardii]|nr:hypothetical protein KP509_1Z314600 [Ceratopteris richardii]
MEEAEMHNYPINTLGCKPGSDSIEGNLLEKARGSPSDVDLRSVMLSGCDLGLSSNHSMNGHTPGVLASRGAMASNRSSLKAATTGADASFYRPILPPQVLVPPSMRATEFPREGVTQSGPSNICHGYFLEAPLECSPPYIEAGQRRHGSNEWTLLNKSKRHFSTEIYE